MVNKFKCPFDVIETKVIWKSNARIAKIDSQVSRSKIVNGLPHEASSGSSTLGLLGLFSISHSPNHLIASLPEGFSLHSCINPVTSNSWIESELSPIIGVFIIVSNSLPVGLFFILLI